MVGFPTLSRHGRSSSITSGLEGETWSAHDGRQRRTSARRLGQLRAVADRESSGEGDPVGLDRPWVRRNNAHWSAVGEERDGLGPALVGKARS